MKQTRHHDECVDDLLTRLLSQLKLAHEALDVCSEAHQRDPRNANILRDRAEAYILNQDYEKGETRVCATCST